MKICLTDFYTFTAELLDQLQTVVYTNVADVTDEANSARNHTSGRSVAVEESYGASTARTESRCRIKNPLKFLLQLFNVQI